MLPKRLRARVFDRLSVRTARHVRPAPARDAEGLVARVYEQVEDAFFINGAITSHSAVPELLAGMWLGGREAVLVSDRLPRVAKEAMGAALSKQNECPYCEDMLVSLVHGAGNHDLAAAIRAGAADAVADDALRDRIAWITAAAGGPGGDAAAQGPFAEDEWPEAIATLLVFGYTNRFTHALFDGSPVRAPLGREGVKSGVLRLFGRELAATTTRPVAPGRGLDLLPPAPLPPDLAWAAPNPRVADALARWAAVVEGAAGRHIPPAVVRAVTDRVAAWQGERMPLGRSWCEAVVAALPEPEAALARLAAVTALASYQLDAGLVDAVWEPAGDEPLLVALLAWASFTGARRRAALAAARRSAPPVA